MKNLSRWLEYPSNIQTQCILVIVTILTFINTILLGNGFVYDDHSLIENNLRMRQWSYFFTIFTKPFGYDTGSSIDTAIDYYRPLPRLLFGLIYRIFGLDPHYWHCVGIVLFVIIVLITYQIFKQLSGQQGLAGLASLLFAVHPIHSEPVVFSNGLCDLLHATFFLGAFALFLRVKDKTIVENKKLIFVGSLFLAFCALLSKEAAVSLPLVIGGYYLIFSDGTVIERIKRAIYGAIPFFTVLGAYFALRLTLYGNFVRMSSYLKMDMVLLTIPRVIIAYLEIFFVPLKLSLIHPVAIVTSIVSIRFWLPVGLVIGLALAIYLTRSRLVIFLGIWIMINLMPVLNVGVFANMTDTARIMQDRYLFISSAGLCLLVALGIINISQYLASNYVRLERIAIILTATIIGGLCFLTVNQNTYWHDDLSLWERAVASHPESGFAQNNLGFFLLGQGDTKRAEQAIRETIRIAPNYAAAYNTLAHILYEQGQFDEAQKQCEISINLNSKMPEPYLNLGNILRKQNKLPEAVAAYRKALVLKPDYTEVYNNLANLLYEQGQLEEAQKQCEISISLNNKIPEPYLNLGNIFRKQNKLAEAVAAYQKVIALKPDYAEVYNNLGVVLAQQQLYPQAKQNFLLALQYRPNYPGAQDNLNKVNSLMNNSSP